MVTEAQCDTCGETNAAGAAFCVLCGAYLGWDVEGRGPTGETGRGEADDAPAPVQSGEPTVELTGQEPAPHQAVGEAPSAPSAAPPAAAAGSPGGVVPGRSGQLPACPSCGHPNDASRRFCERCGFQLQQQPAQPQTAGRTVPPARTRRGWWGSAEERAARRAYRRSLPPLYRWRRVVLAALGLGAAVGLVAILAGNPVEWGKRQWYDVTGATEPLTGVTARPLPEGSVAAPYAIENLLDRSPATAWATAWAPAGVRTTPCGESGSSGAAVTGAAVLTWEEPVRVRGLDVQAGLRRGTERDQQFRPKRLDVTADGECTSFDLGDVPAWQPVPYDSGTEIRRLVISVGEVYEPRTSPEDAKVAISGVRVLTRPG